MSVLVATVPGHQWVTLKNPDPVSSENRILTFGETCSIARGGTVEVLADSTLDDYLVKYTAPDLAGGAACPSGAIFELPKKQFAEMTAEFETIAASERSEIARIRGLLK